MDTVFEIYRWTFILIYVTCTVLTAIRFSGSPAGVLGPIGFGIIALVNLCHNIISLIVMHHGIGIPGWYNGSFYVLSFFTVAAWGLIIAALAMAPKAARPQRRMWPAASACPRCNGAIQEGAVFCAECGERLG